MSEILGETNTKNDKYYTIFFKYPNTFKKMFQNQLGPVKHNTNCTNNTNCASNASCANCASDADEEFDIIDVIDLAFNGVFKSSICGIKLEKCVFNASGPRCTSLEDLVKLNNCKSTGAVLTKSCTLEPREGNPEPRYYGFDGFSINSMGIPNNGVDFYCNVAKTMDKKKPFFISISGLSVEENLELLQKVRENDDIDAVELNVSCPNVIGKPQLGYDFTGLRDFLAKVKEVWGNSNKVLGLKLPPYFDISHFKTVAGIINSNPVVRFLTCSNSLGNGLWIDRDTETAVIKPKNGFGGVGGAAMKATTLANVHKFYQLLGDKVDIIGCGGVTSGDDIFDLILAGAKAVQVGTQFMEHGPVIFRKYLKQLVAVMADKGYKTIGEFHGKLKYIP